MLCARVFLSTVTNLWVWPFEPIRSEGDLYRTVISRSDPEPFSTALKGGSSILCAQTVETHEGRCLDSDISKQCWELLPKTLSLTVQVTLKSCLPWSGLHCHDYALLTHWCTSTCHVVRKKSRMQVKSSIWQLFVSYNSDKVYIVGKECYSFLHMYLLFPYRALFSIFGHAKSDDSFSVSFDLPTRTQSEVKNI